METEVPFVAERDTAASGIAPDILAEVESRRLEQFDAEALLRWGIARFHPRLVLSCSFGAPAAGCPIRCHYRSRVLHRSSPSVDTFRQRRVSRWTAKHGPHNISATSSPRRLVRFMPR